MEFLHFLCQKLGEGSPSILIVRLKKDLSGTRCPFPAFSLKKIRRLSEEREHSGEYLLMKIGVNYVFGDWNKPNGGK